MATGKTNPGIEPRLTWSAGTPLREATGFTDEDRIALGLRAGPWAVLRRLGERDTPDPIGLLVAGSLKKTPVPDVLSLVHSIAQEGELVFSFSDATKRLYLRGGNIVFASSTLVDDRLGEMLLARGRLDRKTFEEASALTVAGKKFGRILVERGILTAHDLYDAVRDQIEGIVHSLFAYTDGTFVFNAQPLSISNPIRLPNVMTHYILEGVRVNDELRMSLESVSDRLVVFRKTATPLDASNAEGHAGMLRDVLALVDGVAPVWQVLARSSWSEVNTLLALARLLKAGVVMRVPLSERVLSTEPVEVPPETYAEEVSGFLRLVSSAIKESGGDPSSLAEYFDSVKADFRGIYSGVLLLPDGAIDSRLIAHNVNASGNAPAQAKKLLSDAMQDLVEFALWVAADQVPYERAATLVAAAASLREGRA